MVTYTSEERAAIIENLKKVKTYVEEELIPKLREREIVRVSVERGLSFAVRQDGEIIFCCGGLCLQFDKEKYPDNNVFDSWMCATKLLLHWKEIKLAIKHEIYKMQEERKTVVEFEV